MRVKAITVFSLIFFFSLLIFSSAFSASIFTVVGTVRNADDTLAVTGLEIIVSNQTKNLTVTTTLSKQEAGKYGVVFIDMENKTAAAEGDSLKVTVKREGDILGSQIYKLTSEDMAKARAIIDVKLKPPANQPPVASFTYSPESPDVGDEITFDASTSSDLDGEIVSYQWDFGDGNTASGERVTHSYDTPYTYVITLTVTDNRGDKGEKMIGLPIPLIGGGSFIMPYSGPPTLEIANLNRNDRKQLYNVIKQVLNIGKAKSKLIGEQDENLLSDVNLLLNQFHPDKQDPKLSVKDVVKENALSEEQEFLISLGGAIAGAGIKFLTGIPDPFGLGEVAKRFGLKLGEWLVLRDMGSATVEYPNVGRMEIVWLRPPEDKILVNIYLKKPVKRGHVSNSRKN